jgi:hypothetical protein
MNQTNRLSLRFRLSLMNQLSLKFLTNLKNQ